MDGCWIPEHDTRYVTGQSGTLKSSDGWVLKAPSSLSATVGQYKSRHTLSSRGNQRKRIEFGNLSLGPCTFMEDSVDITRVSQIHHCFPIFPIVCPPVVCQRPVAPPLTRASFNSSSTRIMSSALLVIDIRNSYGAWMFPSSPHYTTDFDRTGASLLGALMSCMCVKLFLF